MILLVMVNKDDTLINKLNLKDGKFTRLNRYNGYNFREQSEKLILLTLKEKPERLIVESVGLGMGLLDFLRAEMKDYGLELKDDGTVNYGQWTINK